ncbi:MAG: peptidoglycan D,D-transpeptidase FtsI family protein [Eubacteriales bacterium]
MNYNKRIIISLICMSMLFLSIIGYLTYFEFFMKDNIVAHSYNQRLTEYEQHSLRGKIFDRNGILLAYNEGSIEDQKRVYTYKNLYSHIIGYSSTTYSKSSLEAKYDAYLEGRDELSSVMGLKNELTGEEKQGNNLVLTIDHELQQLGSELLKGKSGAVVAMNPETGEVLALVSKPDFNPTEENLKKNWNDIVESDDTSPFFPRATQGRYAPGSIFKVIIAAGAIENGLESFTVEDEGKVTIDGKEFKNAGSKAYGNIGLEEALVHSSNVYYTQMGVQLGAGELKSLVERVGFNQSIPFDFPVSKSTFTYKSMSETAMAEVGIGQGKLQVTPLHMAMITSAIANKGVMMNPVIVQEVVSPGGFTLLKGKYASTGEIMSAQTAQEINNMMQKVVQDGTGQKAGIQGITVAGKTGTAQNEKEDQEHAWFIGFAPADDPEIAVAVIVEYSGSTGGEIAAPIAGKIMSQWLR